jgi:hypothetical protein
MKLSKEMIEPLNTIPALDLALAILEKLKDEGNATIETELSFMTDNIELYNQFFTALCTNLINDEEESCLDMTDEGDHIVTHHGQEDYSETFAKACVILYKS